MQRMIASVLLAGLVALVTACASASPTGGTTADGTGIYSPALDPNRPGAFSGGGGGGGGGGGAGGGAM
jgi:hypothetical protein